MLLVESELSPFPQLALGVKVQPSLGDIDEYTAKRLSRGFGSFPKRRRCSKQEIPGLAGFEDIDLISCSHSTWWRRNLTEIKEFDRELFVHMREASSPLLLTMMWLRCCGRCFAESPESIGAFTILLVRTPRLNLPPKSLEVVVGYSSGGLVEAAFPIRLLSHMSAWDCDVMNHGDPWHFLLKDETSAFCCQLFAILSRSFLHWAVALGKMGYSVLCLYWLLTPNTPVSFKKKKMRRKKKKIRVKKAGIFNAPRKIGCGKNRQIGRCLWVGRRRFAHTMRLYRLKGKCKRHQLLHQQMESRFGKAHSTAPLFHVNQHVHHGSSFFQACGEYFCGFHMFHWMRHWWLGNRQFSLLDPLLSFCWDPMKATRIGEASNPGPAGSRATIRKREEREASDDRQLAGALLAVLQNFQKQDPAKVKGESPAKKGKGGVLKPQHSQGPSLAQSLLQMVQSAIQNNWSDEELTSRLTHRLERAVQPSSPPTESAPRRVRFHDDCRNDEPRSKLCTNGKARGKGKCNADSQKDSKQLPLADTREFPPLNRVSISSKVSYRPQEAMQPVKTPGALQNQKHDRRIRARFAVRVLDREWNGDPMITSTTQILAALRDDKVVPGNLIVSSDPLVVDEAKQIWQAYELSDDLTVAIIAPVQEIGPTLSVWWSSNKRQPLPCKYKVKIHQVGEFDGPTPKAPQVVQMLDVKAPKQVTLRLLTPEHYRSCVAGVHSKDTPVSVISEWAQLLGEPVASLTGGTWERLATPRGQLLLAHIRTSESLAAKVCGLSGRRGLFATVVQKQNRAPVSWQFRSTDATDEAYFREAEKEAQKLKVPLALRQGGPHDVGLVGIDPMPNLRDRRRSWELFGAPSHWCQQQIDSFLMSEGWKNVVLKTRVHRRGQGVWLFQAICPPFQNGESDQGCWHYTNSDSTCHMSITLEGPRKRKAFLTERVTGPKKQWTENGRLPIKKVMATQIDVSDSENEPPKENCRDSKDNSPRNSQQDGSNKRPKTGLSAPEVNADDLLRKNHPQWQIRDDGGSGDCGFRSIARSLAVMQGKEYETPKVTSEASRLRTLCVGHLLKNKEDYEKFFAPDPEATEVQRDGHAEPDSFPDYIMLASKKNFWIDGLLLMGLSHRLGRAFVIFVWSDLDSAWDRHVLAPAFDQKRAKSPGGTPVCLVLKSGHYRALVPKSSDVKIPPEWLMETPAVSRAILRGAGVDKTSLRSLSLPPSTPKSKALKTTKANGSLPALTDVHSPPHSRASSGLSLPSQTPLRLQDETRDKDQIPEARDAELPNHESAMSSCDASLFLSSASQIESAFCSESGRPRKRLRSKQPSEPVVDQPQNPCTPFVPINDPKISVWWVCDCGYQVLKHAELACHGPRRKKHLNQVHGVAFSAMPDPPEGAPESNGTKRHQHEREKRCQLWLTLAKASGWLGLHELVPCQKGWRRWQCLQCDQSFTHWNPAIVSMCNKVEHNHAKIPPSEKKIRLANQWWEKACEQHAADHQSYLDQLNKISFLNNQERLRQTTQSSPQKPFGGIPLVATDPDATKTWWSCSLCEFKILDVIASSEKSRKRKQHLQNVHGICNVRPLSRQGFTGASAIHASQNTVKKRWVRRVEEFRVRRWAGSHDIATDACSISFTQCKSGKTLQFPRYKCRRCNRTVTSGDLAVSLCAMHPQKHKAPPLARRKAIWKKCLQIATKAVAKGSRDKFSHKPDGASATRKGARSNLMGDGDHSIAEAGLSLGRLTKVADGASATRRGKRGERVGEAANPGPSDHHLLAWSVNVRSWYANGPAHLDKATEKGVSLVFFQEMNLSENSCPSVSHSCATKGWQILLCPTASKTTNRGGVAIAVRQPFALSFRSQTRSSEGQTLFAVLHGGQQSIMVAAHYRHPSAKNLDGVTNIMTQLETCSDKSWIVAMDSNSNVTNGRIVDGFVALGGHRVAVARHAKGSYPIDAIFASRNLICFEEDCAELPCLAGDHSRAQASFTLNVARCGMANHRFAKTRSVCSKEAVAVSWDSVASSSSAWAAALSEAESAWNTWARDAEAWLVQAQVLDHRPPEKPLALEPKLRDGAHRLGLFQSLEERQTRRLIRRLTEALFLQHKGDQIPPKLFIRILNSPVLLNEHRVLVRSHAWGHLLTCAQAQLDEVQKQARCDKLQKWKDKIHTLSGACQWAKKAEVAPSVVSDNGQVIVSPALAAARLKTSWENIFGSHAALVDAQNFFNNFFDSLPAPQEEMPLPCISVEDIKKAAKKMSSKAAGPDGFEAEFLLLLPEVALARLAELFSCFENAGAWPRTFLHWKTVFLPKVKKDRLPTLEEMRPIAIGHILYRIWARVRLLHVQSHFKQFLAPFQAGFQGPSCQDLFLSLDQEFPPDTYGYCATLDYAKAFDSLDYSLPVALFQRCGMPASIVNLLSHQWGGQVKWVSFNGTVHVDPIRHAKGLPQGDPWSGLALTLVLSVVCRHQTTHVPDASSLLFLDDRTILAKNEQSLFDAINCWEQFENVSRMRTNAAKTQFVARTYDALLDFQRGGDAVSTVGTVLGVSIGMTPRPDSQHEKDRVAAAARCASRIGSLPVSLRFRAAIAASVLTSKLSWGALFNGRSPNEKSFSRIFKTAVHGNLKNPRASVPLTKFFLWGHRGDIILVACQNMLKALTSWRATRPGISLKLETPVLKVLKSTLAGFKCNLNAAGRVSWPQGFWDTRAPVAFCDKFAHNLRVQWRKIMLLSWLSSDRNDASIARAANLRVSTQLVEKLHTSAISCEGHQFAILCGGLDTHAHLRDGSCTLCSIGQFPTTEHILWDCSRFRDVRNLPPPQELLVARLGWGKSGINHACLSQMAKIRERATAANRSRTHEDQADNAALGFAGAVAGSDPTTF